MKYVECVRNGMRRIRTESPTANEVQKKFKNFSYKSGVVLRFAGPSHILSFALSFSHFAFFGNAVDRTKYVPHESHSQYELYALAKPIRCFK